MQGADMSGTCCTLQPSQSVGVPELPVFPRFDHNSALLPHPNYAVVPAINTAAGWTLSEASPPNTSTGAKSILRI